MSEGALKRLARAAGLYFEWTDANGRPHEVNAGTLRAVLDALGYPAENPKQIAECQNRLDRDSRVSPPLIAAYERESVRVGHAKRARLRTQNSAWRDLDLIPLSVGGMCIRAPEAIGYHDLELDDSAHILAVAPPRCYGVADAAPGRRLAGLSVQIYSLRGGHSQDFGDFAALADFAGRAGALGIDAVAASPTHARFAARPDSISPYSPSSRLFLDPLYADLALAGVNPPDDSAGELIDWPEAHRRKYAQLRAAYEAFPESGGAGETFRQFCDRGDRRLRDHALYEALAAHFAKNGKMNPRDWPKPLHDAHGEEARLFERREEKEVRYFLFLQWLAAESAAAAQARAREKMAVGLIADMAVGVDPSGSHAWSAPHELIGKLSIGAPPDTFEPAGQDWGLTTFSPAALRNSGYDGFIAMLRATMQHAGGIRIDHAMGLRRLWLLPEGASPADGVYVRYPLQDLLRLIALESVLHRAIVIGEDLGTVPQCFRAQIASAGILGMRVLWFEREKDGRFIPPGRWDTQAVALTTTHDLPTVGGWWKGRDIEWSEKLRRKMRLGGAAAESRERKADRKRLWSALREAGCVKGAEPAEKQPEAAVDGALAFVGKTPCVLAIAAAEDIVASPEQPNLPGTTDEHPNWRRRLPERVLERAEVDGRVARLTAAREK